MKKIQVCSNFFSFSFLIVHVDGELSDKNDQDDDAARDDPNEPENPPIDEDNNDKPGSYEHFLCCLYICLPTSPCFFCLLGRFSSSHLITH